MALVSQGCDIQLGLRRCADQCSARRRWCATFSDHLFSEVFEVRAFERLALEAFAWLPECVVLIGIRVFVFFRASRALALGATFREPSTQKTRLKNELWKFRSLRAQGGFFSQRDCARYRAGAKRAFFTLASCKV
jgi:hypothetical protein